MTPSYWIFFMVGGHTTGNGLVITDASAGQLNSVTLGGGDG